MPTLLEMMVEAQASGAGSWVFSHCSACAKNDEGELGHDPGVGCSADGPCDGCEAVWIWKPARTAGQP